MTFRSVLAATTLLGMPLTVLPHIAAAQPLSGIYVGGGAGLNIMQDEHATVNDIGFGNVRSGNYQAELGPAFSVSVGYGLGNGLRAEVEGSYRYNSFGSVSGPTPTTGGGNEQKYGVMVNVLYDFVGFVPFVTPYVGAGVGYQWAQDRNVHLTQQDAAMQVPSSTEGSFAYQGIIGAAMPIAAMPGFSVTLDYRYMEMVADRTSDVGTIQYRGVTAPVNFKFNENRNHTILIGFRYALGATPGPMQPPAPTTSVPSPVSRSYLVFFDWDKATLTDRARQVVAEAATNSTKVQYTRIEVNGYTDTSGTRRYNQGLSVRRAQAVAAELVKDGVPKTSIAIQGFGETHLMVPTGPNVREPQNRRVEIIIK